MSYISLHVCHPFTFVHCFLTLTCHPFCISVLNSYNFTILFEKRLCFKLKYIYIWYIHTYLMLLFVLVFAARISLLFFPPFSWSRGEQGYAVVLVNNPFSDLSFFGSEESIWSAITNPFLDSPKRTHKTSWCLLVIYALRIFRIK